MNISNYENSVPTTVKNLLQSYVPYGSEYVIFCSGYSQSSQTYDLIYKEPLSSDLHQYRVTHNSSGYSVSEVTNNSSYDGFTVSHPYYSVSSERGAGVYEALPYTNTFVPILLIVICSLLILRVVFGGIKLWRSRKYFVY